MLPFLVTREDILQQVETVALVENFLAGERFLHPHKSTVNGEVGMRHSSRLLVLHARAYLMGKPRSSLSHLRRNVNIPCNFVGVISVVPGNP